MAAIKKYNGSTFVDAAIRKYSTASEIITPPTTIYADGTAISTYTIKGNTLQNGTPTPSAPIAVQGVGELETTGEHSGEYKIPILTNQQTTNIYLGSTQSTRQIKKIILTGDEAWLAENTDNFYNNTILDDAKRLMLVLCTHQSSVYTTYVAGIENIWISASGRLNFTTTAINHDVNAFKSYLQQQYANGTPVTVWYVLATAETAAVNEPLMKIGTYADSISNAAAIPTTEGANSITVDTTVQPSEFSATWTGWHNSTVKEWDGSDWQ